jgi:hypothetical protein
MTTHENIVRSQCDQEANRIADEQGPWTDGYAQGELHGDRDPAGDRGEHEPRAALRPRVDGRRLLRRQERRVRRRGRAGRRHGAHHPRLTFTTEPSSSSSVYMPSAPATRTGRDPSRHGTTWRAIVAMMLAGRGAADQPETADERHRSCRKRPRRVGAARWAGGPGNKMPPDRDGWARGGRWRYRYVGYLELSVSLVDLPTWHARSKKESEISKTGVT